VAENVARWRHERSLKRQANVLNTAVRAAFRAAIAVVLAMTGGSAEAEAS